MAWVLAAAALVAGGLGTAWLHPWAEPVKAAAPAGDPQATAAAAAGSGAGPAAVPAPTGDAGQPPAVGPAPARASAVTAPIEGEEICGLGRVTAGEIAAIKPSEPSVLPPRFMAARNALEQRGQTAKAQLAARLAAGSEREQIAARIIMDDAEGAALIAQRSTDAPAYRLALAACRKESGQPASPSCGSLSVARWAELDPQDARPWMRQLEAAMARKDMAAADLALAQLAARPQLSRAGGLLMQTVADAMPAVSDDVGLGLALMDVGVQQGAFAEWDAGAIFRFCNDAAVQDASRRALCRQATRHLLAGASDFLEAKLGLRLAQRTGLPREHWRFDAATLDAAQKQLAAWQLGALSMSCSGIVTMGSRALQTARVGDLTLALSLAASAPH